LVSALRQSRELADPGENDPVRRIMRGERLIQILDLTADRTHGPVIDAAAQLGGVRSIIFVGLVKDAACLGAFAISRREVRPFSDKQIALLQNLAAQAVIAMENARLLTETREALEKQTATAEILSVISSSPTDVQPTFEAIAARAAILCGAASAAVFRFDGALIHYGAMCGVTEAEREPIREVFPLPPGRSSATTRAIDSRAVVHIPDVRADPEYIRALHVFGTAMSVPMLRDGVPMGAITVTRLHVEPFSDAQIELLKTFADQAVIAIETVRLFTELNQRTADLQESLEYQTATSDVLKVISQSDANLTEVLQTALDTAARLCAAGAGNIFLRRGDRLELMASNGVSAENKADMAANPLAVGRESASGRAVLTGQVVHIPDIAADPDYAHVSTLAVGVRTMLGVPLLREGIPIGSISLARTLVQPFSDKQVQLVATFADQAVIAIENARLLGELRERTEDLEESLEYQTATSDVLQVISRSTFDLHPVLDTLLQTAARLCNSDSGGVTVKDGDVFRYAAIYGVSDELTDVLRQRTLVPGRDTVAGRTVLEGRVVHLADITTDPSYKWGEVAASNEIRSVIGVPLLRGTEVTGTFSLARNHVERFSERQIELVRTFADQAVIAIENTRLLNEIRERTADLQESLEYQTATSEVLQVISRSTFDLHPVLDTLLETATRLCVADGGAVTIREGEAYRFVAVRGHSDDFAASERNRVVKSDSARWRLLQERIAQEGAAHIVDILALPEFSGDQYAATSTMRSILVVPMLRDGAVAGLLHFFRFHVEPFSERQIELVRTFADQAVIAIENTRLLEELRESLAQQQAIAEILQVINRSPGELQPVFDAILEKAMALCDVSYGDLELYDGKSFRAVATRGLTDSFDAQVRRGYPANDNPATRPLIAGERVSHIANMADLDFSKVFAHEPVKHEGHHTLLCVPLRRDDALLGMIACARGEVRAFSEKEIALLENFAAQAVIAMDNARLLDEIRQRQAELRVTFDNMGDGVAMFDAEHRLAAWNRNFQQILDVPDELLAERPSLADYVRYLAAHGEYGAVDVEAEVRRLTETAGTQWSAERTRPDGRVIEVRHNPVPSGGFVLIYGDITERKRAEAEIHAARDAAERALGELKVAQASLIQAEKMASLGQLTAGIAHEIKNPLNFVNNFAGLSVELLEELKETAGSAIAGLAEDERADVDEIVAMLTGNLEKIAEHGRRADGIVKSMLEHSRGGSGERREVDLNDLVEEALNLAYHGARAQDQSFNITLERDLDHALASIELVPQDMTRVFLNLFGNGFYAATKRQRGDAEPNFRPALKVATHDLGEAVEIRIRDNGTGIPPDIRDKLFQPFFTTKPTGEGTGLGLSISWDIVTQQHGGTIEVDSRVGEFTEFTIHLPRS
jgi:two-component system, NtrC family, sensor kinase